MDLHELMPDDLEVIRTAAADFRHLWAGVQQFSCRFEGDFTDIYALDYLDYEGLDYPPCGRFGATLDWGQTLVVNGPMQWRLNDRGEYVITESDGTRIVILPAGRIEEAQSSSIPQFGKYWWAMERAILDCIIHHVWPDEGKAVLKKLWDINDEGGLIESVALATRRIVPGAILRELTRKRGGTFIEDEPPIGGRLPS